MHECLEKTSCNDCLKGLLKWKDQYGFGGSRQPHRPSSPTAIRALNYLTFRGGCQPHSGCRRIRSLESAVSAVRIEGDGKDMGPDKARWFWVVLGYIRNDLRLLLAGAGASADFGCRCGIECSPIIPRQMLVATVAVRCLSCRHNPIPRMPGYDASTASTTRTRIGLVAAPPSAVPPQITPAKVRFVVADRIVADADS